MLWTKRARTLLLFKCGITKINENAKYTALKLTHAVHRENVSALGLNNNSDLRAATWFSLSQSSVFYRVYVAQWWQKVFTFIDYSKFQLFRAFLSIDPNDPELIKLVDQTLLNMQFGPTHPPVTEVIFVRARILDLRLKNWEVFTAFHSKACIRTETGIAIKAQPRWLKPLNVFPQNFLLACAYIPYVITFTGLLLGGNGAMNTFTFIAFCILIVTTSASVICFRLGRGWEIGERVLTQIYTVK
jgi:hypothetical protein